MNKARAVERDLEVIANYWNELARDGLIDAHMLQASDSKNARRDMRLLHQNGVISQALSTRMQAIVDARNKLTHHYPDVRAASLHDLANEIVAVFTPFSQAYVVWLGQRGSSLT